MFRDATAGHARGWSHPFVLMFLATTVAWLAPTASSAQTCSGPGPNHLGVVARVHGVCPLGSGPVPNTRCILLEVGCPGLTPQVVQLRITEPDATVPERGTVWVGSGGSGAGFYSNQTGASTLFDRLVAMGFRMVDRAWPAPGWISGENGMRVESCRGATLLTWVRDSLHQQGAFVATGNSGGSGEIAFMLGHWGRESLIDLAVPTGGPPFAAMDDHCGLDPTWSALCPGIVPPDSTDCASIGCVIPPTHFACTQCAATPTAAQLEWDSLVNADADLDYPGTKVHFILGRDDCSSAVPQAMVYFNAINTDKELQFIPNTPHFVPTSAEGREAIIRAIDLGTPPVAVSVAGVRTPRVGLSVGPNPFAERVRFRIAMPLRGRVSLQLYDVAGRRIETVMDGVLEPGVHAIELDANERATGVLFYRLRALDQTRRGTLLRRR